MTRSAADSTVAMESLKYIVDHVFLPPKTPQEDDTTIAEEHRLISSLLDSVKAFSKCLAPEAKNLEPVVRMLQRLLKVKPGMESNTKKTDMKQVVLELGHDGTCRRGHLLSTFLSKHVNVSC